MRPLRPQLRGLTFKLALFYVLLSLPSLLLVESGLLLFEFNRFTHSVENGSLTRAADAAAADLADTWPQAAQDEAAGLATWAQARVLRLQRPRGGLLEDESYILVELAAEPVAIAVLSARAQPLAQWPPATQWRTQGPAPDSADWLALGAGRSARMLAAADDSGYLRRALAPVRAADGALRGAVLVELHVPWPWHRFLSDLSLEWPVVLGYLIVFGIASSIFLSAWVTRRLNRVARAASAWSAGNFSDRIADASRDELGRLSTLLDDMALQLKDLVRSRAQLATMAERQRLARDLHDTVKQKAFALNLQLAGARRQLGEHTAGERVAQAERLSQQIQQELAHILDELRTESGLAFAERLRMRAQEWAQASGLGLEADIDTSARPAAAHEDTLLRISDEALANVLRHSGANRATVTLRRDANTLRLTIMDNGRGAGDESRPGMGLGNMRQRAESLPGGRFEFDSSPERGTRVTVSFVTAGRPNA